MNLSKKPLYALNGALAIARLLFSSSSILHQKGWIRSASFGIPETSKGVALPWYTYAATEFLSDRINPSFRVFEFGCGGSTLWFANRVAKVVSCEHDLDWYNSLNAQLPENCELIFKRLEEDYSAAAASIGEVFDILIIDGRNRNNCIYESWTALKKDGVVLWDDAERASYAEGHKFLTDRGFKRLDFSGMGPINAYSWTTSIFYRETNCLRI